mgnify:FL=1|tara:strand:+ start:108 stop:1400 length:1293 start_codon:yes stop_codon:yes gene_type:complete
MKFKIFNFLKEIFPINRSLTGQGNRDTLKLIKNHIPLKIKSVKSGYKAYDWTVPKEWKIKDAYVKDQKGHKVIDFKDNNLHLVGYSTAINKTVSKKELKEHLYSIEDKPNAIPYITSYYEDKWGFCIKHEDLKKLNDDSYQVYIDSTHKNGYLDYGELIIPGKSKKEILLSTYICHPSMGNNECSGIAVTTFLAKWLLKLKNRKYTYRILFLPETLGPIVYLSKHLKKMKKNTIAGFVITCVGDNLNYSFLESRKGNTLCDRVARHVLDNFTKSYNSYSYLQRGSDERQYCHPLVDLPVCSIMRSKYGTYSEYHTSLDNLDFVSAEGLNGSFDILKKCIVLLEKNLIYKNKIICEPKLKDRGIHPKNWEKRHTGNNKKMRQKVLDIVNVISYTDGSNTVLDICEKININFEDCIDYLKILQKQGIIKLKK